MTTIDEDLAGRREIELVMSRANAETVKFGLTLLKSIFDGGRKYKAGDLVLILNDTSISIASKSMALVIGRSWRVWADMSTIESVAALKNLLWLREKLRTHGSVFREQDRHLADDARSGTGPHNPMRNERDILQDGIDLAYRLCVGRTPTQEEISICQANLADGLSFPQFLCSMHDGQESQIYLRSKSPLPGLSDGAFIQLAYEAFYSRGSTASEIIQWGQKLRSGVVKREDVLLGMFSDYAKATTGPASEASVAHDPDSCHVMGTSEFITRGDWKKRQEVIAAQSAETDSVPVSYSRFYINKRPTLLISAITSLYRGGKFIEQFMDNITSQTCFREYCELIIIDADSPENESKVIERFCSEHKNIVYKRVNHRIGIYDAWNIAIKLAKGDYLTNANLDDLRRSDSLELQAAVLDNLLFVDVVYQDFYYSFDPHLTFSEIARFGYKSNLPVITAHNLMRFNSPHNAPMWRKTLHDKHGLFDTSYRSAGDYEFWVRCLTGKTVFYKINDAHVAYYQNPEGISTRPDTRGVDEAKRILKTYARRLISPDVVVPIERFIREISPDHDASHRAVHSRYAIVQSALRDAAANVKFATPHRMKSMP
jgi:glycosyltransferase involved in cell wall biosynthesis